MLAERCLATQPGPHGVLVRAVFGMRVSAEFPNYLASSFIEKYLVPQTATHRVIRAHIDWCIEPSQPNLNTFRRKSLIFNARTLKVFTTFR